MAILSTEGVRLGLAATDKADALTQCGELLVAIGAADEEYAAALHVRETQVTTYIGEGVAIPHGTNESREHINRAAIAYLQFPEGVDWDGNEVHVCIAIASRSEEHIEILSRLASILMDPEAAAKLRDPSGVEDVLALLAAGES